MRNAYKVWYSNLKGAGQIEDRSKWENNVEMNLAATRYGRVSRGNELVHWGWRGNVYVTCGNSVTSRWRTSVPRRMLLRGVITLQRRMELVEWRWEDLTRDESQYEETIRIWMKRPKSRDTCSCFGFELCAYWIRSESDYSNRFRNYMNIGQWECRSDRVNSERWTGGVRRSLYYSYVWQD